MKSRTTIIGALLAALIVAQPLLTEAGYVFDKALIVRLVFAGLVAALGYFTKDSDGDGIPDIDDKD